MMHILDIISKINTVADIRREVGTGRFIREIIPWTFHRNFFFYAQSLRMQFPVQSCQIPFRLKLIKKEDLPYLLDVRPAYYRLVSLQERLNEGHLCFLGWSGQIPVNIRWAFVQSVYLPYLHKTLILFSGDALGDEAYTKPEYRRLGVYSYSAYLMRCILHDMGYHRLISAFAPWNISPQNANVRLGMKKVGGGGYWNIPGMRKFFWEGLVQDNNEGNISIRRDE